MNSGRSLIFSKCKDCRKLMSTKKKPFLVTRAPGYTYDIFAFSKNTTKSSPILPSPKNTLRKVRVLTFIISENTLDRGSPSSSNVYHFPFGIEYYLCQGLDYFYVQDKHHHFLLIRIIVNRITFVVTQ